MKCIKRSIAFLLMLSVILTIFGGCDFGDTDSGEADTVLGNGSSVLSFPDRKTQNWSRFWRSLRSRKIYVSK